MGVGDYIPSSAESFLRHLHHTTSRAKSISEVTPAPVILSLSMTIMSRTTSTLRWITNNTVKQALKKTLVKLKVDFRTEMVFKIEAILDS